MNSAPKFEFLDAITSAAAEAYIILDRKVGEDDVLAETLRYNRLDPIGLIVAQGGLRKYTELRWEVLKKVEDILSENEDNPQIVANR